MSVAVAGPGGDVPDGRFALAEAAGYAYQLFVYPTAGRLRRWRGCIVRTNPTGQRTHSEWRTSRSQEDLVERLWYETVRDIHDCIGPRTPIAVVADS